ncbi:MAG: hypothetical protein ACE5R6_03580 [Candidatus Heimdallarchaeota archaeon]
MVAVTKKIPYKELIKPLKAGENIAIFTCNTCPRMYETGGVEIMNELAVQLEKDGYNVTDKIVLTAACFEDFFEEMKPLISDHWTTGIVLACDSGWGVVQSHLSNKQIVRGLTTVGIQQGREPKPVVLLEG